MLGERKLCDFPEMFGTGVAGNSHMEGLYPSRSVCSFRAPPGRLLLTSVLFLAASLFTTAAAIPAQQVPCPGLALLSSGLLS